MYIVPYNTVTTNKPLSQEKIIPLKKHQELIQQV